LGVPFVNTNVRLSALAFFAEKCKKALKQMPQSLPRVGLIIQNSELIWLFAVKSKICFSWLKIQKHMLNFFK